MRRMSGGDIVITADDRMVSSGHDSTVKPGKKKPAARSSKPAPAASAAAGAADAALPKTARRRFRPRLYLTMVQKIALGGVGLTALVVGAAVVWHSGIIQNGAQAAGNEMLSVSAQAGFRVREITITGRARTPMDAIAGALDSRHGAPILGVDLDRVRDRLETIPSVDRAVVERRLPDTLNLRLVERAPIAVWQIDGDHLLVDKSGQVIPGPITGYEDLPLVVGEGAGARAEELLSMLRKEQALGARVKAAVRVASRRWNVYLDDAQSGLEIRLPEDQAEAAWHRLAQLDREQGVTGRAVSMIDLRTPDRLVLKTEKPAQSAETPKRNKDNTLN